MFTSNKPGLQTYSKSSEWTRPLGTTESIGSLAPPLPPTFLPPPNPLRLVASKSDAGRPSPLAQQQHPGPPTPTFRSDFVNMRYSFTEGKIVVCLTNKYSPHSTDLGYEHGSNIHMLAPNNSSFKLLKQVFYNISQTICF